MIRKLIVMLVSVMRGRIQERTRNFGHLVHETCPRNCVWSVYKFYKKQTKSENHETCWDVVISYVEAMIKISEDFVHVVTYDAYKPGHLHMWYHTQFRGHVSWTRCPKFRVRSWIRPLITLTNMTINFRIIKLHYSYHVQFKFLISRKIQVNEIK